MDGHEWNPSLQLCCIIYPEEEDVALKKKKERKKSFFRETAQFPLHNVQNLHTPWKKEITENDSRLSAKQLPQWPHVDTSLNAKHTKKASNTSFVLVEKAHKNIWNVTKPGTCASHEKPQLKS